MMAIYSFVFVVDFFFASRRRHTRAKRDWSSDVCSSDLRGRGRENERGRFRSPTEDLMPDEDREEAEEGEAQAPPEGSAELSVIYEDHHDDGGQGYEGRTGERKADDAVADRRKSVRARGTIARPHLTPPAPPGSARGSRSRAPGPFRRACGRCIVPLRRGT